MRNTTKLLGVSLAALAAFADALRGGRAPLERAGRTSDSTRHLLRARTAELVEQHWAVIESVARALLRHEEFDAVQAERICERAVPVCSLDSSAY